MLMVVGDKRRKPPKETALLGKITLEDMGRRTGRGGWQAGGYIKKTKKKKKRQTDKK